jgi:hypothetical protein
MRIQIEMCCEVRPFLIFLVSVMHHGSERGNAIHVTTGREAHRVVRKLAYLP